MRILLGADENDLAQVQNLHAALARHGVDSRIFVSRALLARLPVRGIANRLQDMRKFRRLLVDFEPDAMYTSCRDNFTLAAIKRHIPTVLNLRGDVWTEHEWAKIKYTSRLWRVRLAYRFGVSQKCLARADAVWSISHYLDRIVKARLPNQKTDVFPGCLIDADWVRQSPHKLRHPCVGILQKATIIGKVREMEILRDVIPKFPDVMFYWAGWGGFEDKIMGWLGGFPNFKRLGRISFPEGVRDFISEIDILAQVSGADTLGRSLLETQLVGTPVIASDVGGCHEAIVDRKTGFLVRSGDPGALCDKIRLLLQDKRLAADMGRAGRRHVLAKFDPDRAALDFIRRMSALLP